MTDFAGENDLDAVSADPVDAGPEVAAQEGPSIDDAIAAAFDKAEGATDEAGQPRDPMGRFAAKQAEEAAAAESGKAADAAATAVGAMPAAWGRDKAELWARTPVEVQAYIAQREQQISDGFKQYEGLAEFADLAASNGGSLRQTLATVRDLDNLVTSDPVRGFAEIMGRIGYDPAKVARSFLGIQDDGSPAPQLPAPQLDPAIQRTIQQLQGEVQTLRMQPYQQQVEAFASDPANKYFDKLIGPMQAMIASERGLSLKDAYDRACWADPQVRSELLKEQQAVAAKAHQLTKSTQTAERASRGLTPSNASPVKAPPRAMSIDESINAAFAQYE